jgi:hypothetical protein
VLQPLSPAIFGKILILKAVSSIYRNIQGKFLYLRGLRLSRFFDQGSKQKRHGFSAMPSLFQFSKFQGNSLQV